MEKVIRDANGERVHVGDLVSYSDGTVGVYRVEAFGEASGTLLLAGLKQRSCTTRTFTRSSAHVEVLCSASQWEGRPTDLSQALYLLDRVDYFADELSSDNAYQESCITEITGKLRVILKGLEA